MSSNDRYIAFVSLASNLVPSNVIIPYDEQYVLDRRSGRIERVSVNNHGGIAGTGGMDTHISANGRYVQVSAHGQSCGIGGTANPDCDLFLGSVVHDRETGQNDVLASNHGEFAGTDALGGVPDRNLRHLTFATASNRDPKIGWENSEVFISDRGPHMWKTGTNGPNVGVVGRAGSSTQGAAAVVDATDDALSELPGAELIGASVAHRPDLDDLFIRIEVDKLPVITGTNLISFPMLYGMRFDTPKGTYELRAGGLVGTALNVPLGLFSCTPTCSHVSDVKGSYGTTGERVTFSLPLAEIGLEKIEDLKDVVAFSALGSFETGATKILDSVKLR